MRLRQRSISSYPDALEPILRAPGEIRPLSWLSSAAKTCGRGLEIFTKPVNGAFGGAELQLDLRESASASA